MGVMCTEVRELPQLVPGGAGWVPAQLGGHWANREPLPFHFAGLEKKRA